MCILRSARKDQLCFPKYFRFHVQCCRGATSRVIHSSDGPRTVATGWLIYHPGPFRDPRWRQKRQLDGTRGYYLFTEIGKNNLVGLERVVYGLTVWWKRRENWKQPLRLTGARTGCLNCSGAREIGREPAGHRTEMAKISIFTGRTGPGSDLWKPLQGLMSWARGATHQDRIIVQ